MTGCGDSGGSGSGSAGGGGAAKPSGGSATKAEPAKIEDWGEANGKPVKLVTITNGKMTAKITNWGTILTSLQAPDKEGKLADVVLGFDTLEPYVVKENRHPYFGATAGRVANRIAKGKFTVDGVDYTVATNNGPNHLHGGEDGFDRRVWDIVDSTPSSVKFKYLSADGEEGYPGTVTATVQYTLTDDQELKIEFSATADKATPINLAHHTYWNLGGHDSGSVLDETLQISAEKYTPTDDTLIPTGEFASVEGTPYDFRDAKPLGKDIDAFKKGYDNENRHPSGGGYDINFVLTKVPQEGQMRQVAILHDPKSGRTMTLYANQPGVQLYTGNWLDGVKGKGGAVYNQHNGVCLETQVFPDAIHHQDDPAWPKSVLWPGETYSHIMVHKFTAE
ncbi:MAG: galactose-1-epimerase [Phycisphaera sp.]|nr:galactose-1-epimerase [Phycisphaera sp.]